MSKASNTNKMCVFCGNPPQAKTKEHIIPKWLIELTGDPNREAFFGAHTPHTGQQARQRKYAFSSFKFPACRACNDEYAKLESQTNYIMLKVLANEAVDNDELTTLLDWFDKVRVGLWLAFNSLDEMSDIIKPTLNINLGRRLKDRLLFVYDFENPARNSLTFMGANSPIFYLMPNSFILMVKDKLFLSAAADYLVAKGLGFPYGQYVALDEASDNPIYMLHAGTGQTDYPLLDFPYVPGGTELYQAVISRHNVLVSAPDVPAALLGDEYVIANSLQGHTDSEQVRVSRVFYKKPSGTLTQLAQDEKLSLQPPARMRPEPMGDVVLSLFASFQRRIWLSQLPTVAAMTPWQRSFMPQAIKHTIDNQVEFIHVALSNERQEHTE